MISQTWGTERFSGDHEQRLLPNSSAVIFQNPSVTTLTIRQLTGGKGPQTMKGWEPLY